MTGCSEAGSDYRNAEWGLSKGLPRSATVMLAILALILHDKERAQQIVCDEWRRAPMIHTAWEIMQAM